MSYLPVIQVHVDYLSYPTMHELAPRYKLRNHLCYKLPWMLVLYLPHGILLSVSIILTICLNLRTIY
jgi:hypothetical protein